MYESMSNPRASLLGIPLELRHQIYALCLYKWVAHDPCSRRAIASVCRQTRSEAFPMLLHEHRSFTLENLRTWTASGIPDLLREITDVFFSDCALRYAGEGSDSHLISKDDVSAIIRPIFSSIPNLRRARFILKIDDLGQTPGHTESQENFLRIVATLLAHTCRPGSGLRCSPHECSPRLPKHSHSGVVRTLVIDTSRNACRAEFATISAHDQAYAVPRF